MSVGEAHRGFPRRSAFGNLRCARCVRLGAGFALAVGDGVEEAKGFLVE